MSGLFDLRILLADDLAFTDAFEAALRAFPSKEGRVDGALPFTIVRFGLTTNGSCPRPGSFVPL